VFVEYGKDRKNIGLQCSPIYGLARAKRRENEGEPNIIRERALQGRSDLIMTYFVYQIFSIFFSNSFCGACT
jgi:hypothetical protein